MPSSKKKADAKASGKSKAARDAKPTRMLDESPFVGRPIHIAFDPRAEPSARLDCIAHVGDFICVRGEAGDVWVNLGHVAQVVVAGDSDAPDSVSASDFPALKSRYGSVEVKVAEGKRPDKAG